MHRRRAPKTGLRPSRRGQPGSPPLSGKQQLYIRLVSEGMNNSAGCRAWASAGRPGPAGAMGRRPHRSGHVRTYASITRPPRRPAISAKFLSERERLAIADSLLAGESLRAIARQLGRSPSTVSREVANNADAPSGRYRPSHSSAAFRGPPRPAQAGQVRGRRRARQLCPGPPGPALEPRADKQGVA